jgi:hypothetical protein
MTTEPEAVEPPPVRVWRRLFVAAGVLTLFVVAFAVVRWAYERHRTANSLAALVARLDADDPGWKLDEIQAARADPPAGQNSADVIVAVAKLVPGNWPYWDYKQEFEHLRFDGLPPARQLDPERAKMLAEEMAKMTPALAQARRLAAMPRGKHTIEFKPNPIDTLLNDQQDSRKAAGLLRYDAWDLAQKGDLRGSLLACRASINAGRSLADEPTGISQLIRVACVAVGLSGVERALSLGEATDADLAEVQALLRLEEQHPTALIVTRGERAMQHAFFDGVAKGTVSMTGPSPGGPWYERLFALSGLNMPRQHLRILETLTELVEVAKLPPHEQASREAESDRRASALPRGDIFVKLLLPSVVKMNQAWRRHLGQVRALDTLVAVERYRLKNGKWPENLEDIPGEFLPAVPLDPYDGKPVRYRRTADGVVVYVLGENLKDDGGLVERPAGVPPDWGYRLWDVSQRRQPPPLAPKPAGHDPGPGN